MTLCLTEKALRKVEAKMKGAIPTTHWITPGANATVHIWQRPKGEKVCAVCIGPTKGMDLATVTSLIVHEAVHIWQEYRADFTGGEPGVEQEAYGVQIIVDTLLREYIRQKKYRLKFTPRKKLC